MMNEQKRNGTMSIGTLILVVFIILKITGLISWSWVWVLSPLWISAIITILSLVVSFIIIVKRGKAE